MTFEEFSAINRLRNKTYFPECASWTEIDWSNAMAGEAGEVCNKTKKRKRMWRESDNITTEDLMGEIADVICYADLLAESIGVSLEEAIRSKFNEVSDRYDCLLRL